MFPNVYIGMKYVLKCCRVAMYIYKYLFQFKWICVCVCLTHYKLKSKWDGSEPGMNTCNTRIAYSINGLHWGQVENCTTILTTNVSRKCCEIQFSSLIDWLPRGKEILFIYMGAFNYVIPHLWYEVLQSQGECTTYISFLFPRTCGICSKKCLLFSPQTDRIVHPSNKTSLLPTRLTERLVHITVWLVLIVIGEACGWSRRTCYSHLSLSLW